MKTIIIALLTGAATLTAGASTFDNVVETIIAASPTLAAEDARMTSDLDALRAEGIPADPEVEFEHLWNAAGGDNRWSAGISQEIDWPGTYRLRSKAISAQTRLTEARRMARRTEARTATASLLIEIIAAKKEEAILSEIDSSMQSLNAQLKKAWDNGEANIIDLNKTGIEVARSAVRLEKARNTVASLMAELQGLSGTDIKEIQALIDGLDLPLAQPEPADTYLAALEASPEMTQTRLAVDAAEAQTNLERSRRLPGFSVGYAHTYEDGTHFNGITAGIRLPVWSRRAAVSSAVSASLAAKFEVTATRTRLVGKVLADHAAAEALRKQIALLAPAVEGTNNLTLLRKAFEGGELNLLIYLQEVNYFLEARLDYLSLTRDYALLLASLHQYLPAE